MAMRVYDGDEVDRYVAALNARIEELNQAAAVPAGDDAAREEAERVLGRALLQAQHLADTMLAEAQRQATAIIEEAEAARREAARRAEAATRAAEESRRLAAEDIRRMTEAALAEARARASSILAAARDEHPVDGSRHHAAGEVAGVHSVRPGPDPEPFSPGWTPAEEVRTEAVAAGPLLYAPPPTGEPVLPWDVDDDPGGLRRRRRLFSR